jgi:putative copper export protein
MELKDGIGLISRWLHIGSTVVLLGGVFFARQVLRGQQESDLVTRYAKVWQVAVAGLLLSGLYNFLNKAAYPPGYHAAFGIKFLLALHVFAVALLLGRGGVDGEKRRRQMTGVLASGAVILALGAWLRYLSR